MEQTALHTDGHARTTVLAAEFDKDYADAMLLVASGDNFRQDLQVVVIANPGEIVPVGFSRTPYRMEYNRDYQAVRAAGQDALDIRPENIGPRDYEAEGIHDRTVRAKHVGCLIIHNERVEMGTVRDLARAALGHMAQQGVTRKKASKASETAA